jgi:hypothetical protein
MLVQTKPTNDLSTQHIFLDIKRQLRVLATEGSHHRAIRKREYEGNTYNCNLLSHVSNFAVYSANHE